MINVILRAKIREIRKTKFAQDLIFGEIEFEVVWLRTDLVHVRDKFTNLEKKDLVNKRAGSYTRMMRFLYRFTSNSP